MLQVSRTHVRDGPAVARLRLLGHERRDGRRRERRLELRTAPGLYAVPHRQLLLQRLHSYELNACLKVMGSKVQL